MDLVQHLRYFLVLADELHFGRAAARLHMAQPPLSQSIRRLEREYGTALFDRSGGRVRLTPAGEVLRDAAHEIVAGVERSQQRVRQVADGAAGGLRVGIPPHTPGRVLAALSAAQRRALPDLDLDLRAVTTAEQLHLLGRADGIDVGLLQHPADTGGLATGPIVAIPEGVVVSRRSALAQRTELTLADLAGHGLVLFTPDAAPDLYADILQTCHRHGFTPSAVRHAANSEFLLGLVAAGQDVAFDQGATAQKEPRVVWRPLVGNPLAQRLCAAWPRTTPHPAAARFADLITEVLVHERETQAPTPLTDAPQPPASRPWSVVFPSRLPAP